MEIWIEELNKKLDDITQEALALRGLSKSFIQVGNLHVGSILNDTCTNLFRSVNEINDICKDHSLNDLSNAQLMSSTLTQSILAGNVLKSRILEKEEKNA